MRQPAKLEYEKVGKISEGARQALVALVQSDVPKWEICQGEFRFYYCWNLSPRVMFVKIPPGGRVDPHRDTVAKGNRWNVILTTNPQCVNYIGVGDRGVHLELGGIFAFDATQEHWAVNNGGTDRYVMVETR